MTAKILDPRVTKLVNAIAKHVDPLSVNYAIGGALAMAAHGFSRYTSDVDIFTDDDGRPKILHALRKAGLETATIFSPSHYIAKEPEETDPEVRIDILVPAPGDEPEASAVDYPDRKKIGGHTLSVFEKNLLIYTKFQHGRAEDKFDIVKMYQVGLFDPKVVLKMMRAVAPDTADDFAAFLKQIQDDERRPKRTRPSVSPKPPGRRRTSKRRR